jgi:hypothetical protein
MDAWWARTCSAIAASEPWCASAGRTCELEVELSRTGMFLSSFGGGSSFSHRSSRLGPTMGSGDGRPECHDRMAADELTSGLLAEEVRPTRRR